MKRARQLLVLLCSFCCCSCTLAETEAHLLNDLRSNHDAALDQQADTPRDLRGEQRDLTAQQDAPVADVAADLVADLAGRDHAAGDLRQDGPGKDLPAIPPDLPLLPLEGGACPTECVNACQGGVCKPDCSAGCTCPAGYTCEIDCVGPSSCLGPIDCRQAKACIITCNDNACLAGIQCGAACTVGCFLSSCGEISCGAESCKITCAGGSCGGDISCGPGSCSIDCFDSSCAGTIDCSSSCACSTTCAAGACSGTLFCPSGCSSSMPAGCTTLPPAQCDQC